MIDTDASVYEFGAIRFHRQNDKKLNEWVMIAYWSRMLKQAEGNKSETVRDCPAVLLAIQFLCEYIEGISFKSERTTLLSCGCSPVLTQMEG